MNPPCDFCGQPYELHVLEVYLEERTFTISACCEGAQDDASAWLAEPLAAPRREVCEWFRHETDLTIRAVVPDEGVGLRFGNGGLTLDFGLDPCTVSLAEAKAFIAEHHRHSKPPVGWKWGHGLRNGPDLVAVAMVGRPVARGLDHRTVAEVNRVCTDPGLGKLTWNACSMLYSAAAREARRRGFERAVSYIHEDEMGTSLRAAGWAPVARVRPRRRGWDTPSRPRDGKPTVAKVRYELDLKSGKAGSR